jgi:serine/threonine protein kinase
MVSSHAGSTARELRSLQSLQSLDHPCLVRTHGVWSVPGYIVIAMELAEATLLDLMFVYHNDLAQHIPIAQLCLHMWQVAEGLDFLNARRHMRDNRRVGFQHGDIKPNNILLFGDVAKLTDYGLATPTHGPTTPCPRHGTRDYAAPEVLQGYLTDTSDQYSLAVTYHVLRTGTFPFPAVPTGNLPKSYQRPPADLSMLLAPEQQLLTRALSPIPQDRFPSCQDMVRGILKAFALKAVRGDEGGWLIVQNDDTAPERPIQASSRTVANLAR